MNGKKFLFSMMSILVIASMIISAGSQAYAQSPEPLGGDGNGKDKITQRDLQAAADRAAVASLTTEEIGQVEMALPGAAPYYFSRPYYSNSPLTGNAVVEWNAIAQEILQPPPMPGMPMPMGVSMSAAFVYLAYTQAAVYNALVAIEGRFLPYNSSLRATLTGGAPKILTDVQISNASRDAAVVTAAYGVLKNYFPMDPTLDGKLAASLALITEDNVTGTTAKADGITVGQAAAVEIIALRAGDVLSGNGGYVVPAPGQGVWEPAMGVAPMDPWMRVLTPFMRATPEQYRPAPPPALNDPGYLADLAEVRDIGGAMSMTRTLEQKAVALFWTTNMVIQTNASYRQLAATRGLGLLETARLMALGNMAACDSLIATFDAKYEYNFWRPVTAIHNDLTDPDLAWMPLAMTPNFPEYVAGHGSFVSAQAEVYEYLFGPQIDVTLSSSITGTTRHYATAADLRTEIVNARTWAGLHFRNSSVLAVALGEQIVTDAVATYFIPDPNGQTFLYLPIIHR